MRLVALMLLLLSACSCTKTVKVEIVVLGDLVVESNIIEGEKDE